LELRLTDVAYRHQLIDKESYREFGAEGRVEVDQNPRSVMRLAVGYTNRKFKAAADDRVDAVGSMALGWRWSITPELTSDLFLRYQVQTSSRLSAVFDRSVTGLEMSYDL